MMCTYNYDNDRHEPQHELQPEALVYVTRGGRAAKAQPLRSSVPLPQSSKRCHGDQGSALWMLSLRISELKGRTSSVQNWKLF